MIFSEKSIKVVLIGSIVPYVLALLFYLSTDYAIINRYDTIVLLLQVILGATVLFVVICSVWLARTGVFSRKKAWLYSLLMVSIFLMFRYSLFLVAVLDFMLNGWS